MRSRLLILAALWPANAAAAPDLPTIDDAFPPSIRVEPAGPNDCRVVLDRRKLDVASAPLSWLTVEVSSKGRCRSAELAIDVPAGARVIGMAVSSRGERSWSAARPVREARDAFSREPDAALLVWDSTSADQDHLRLSVVLPARIELAIELPALPRVIVEARGRGRAEIDLRGIAARTDQASYSHAGETIALVTGAPNRDEALEAGSSGRWSHAPSWWSDKSVIRRQMKLSIERITHCYERVAQWRGEIQGDVTLQFLIGPDGKVVRVGSTSNGLPATVTTCLEEEVAAWDFGPRDGMILVNYPLRFSTPR